TGTFDHVGIVAEPAQHRVVGGSAVQHVVADVAGEDIGQPIARGIDVGTAGQGQILDIGSQSVGRRGEDRVCTLVVRLGDQVGRAVHKVGVVASAAIGLVGPSAADEDV